MTPMIASILNLMGPDMMVILLIVLLLFGAKKLPELARGMGRAGKEFSAARDEIERGLGQSDPLGVAQPKLRQFLCSEQEQHDEEDYHHVRPHQIPDTGDRWSHKPVFVMRQISLHSF